MKTIKIVSLISFLVLVAACGSDPEPAAPEAAAPTYTLLASDSESVVFTAYETSKATPAQIQLFDSDLAMVLDKVTYPSFSNPPSYALISEPTKIVLFGVEYAGSTIDQIVCDKSNDVNFQLYFSVAGIYWAQLDDMSAAPIIDDRTLSCSGGGKTFDVDLFKDNGISDDLFTLYVDFIHKTFRGRIVVTEAGKDPKVDGVVLNFR